MTMPSPLRVRRTGVSLAGVLLIAGLVALFGRAFAANIIVNGGFETGDFTGWTVYNQPGGAGNWYVYSGTRTPISNLPIAAPPEGKFAAVSDTDEPGSHELYQDIAVPANSKTTLSFYVYYRNNARAFANPATLDFRPPTANQQYRVDLINPGAPIQSVAAGDVLQNLFQTKPGDPLTLAPTQLTFDLTPYAGTTVRLRIAEVDNTGVFNASVDNVQVTSVAPTPPPAASGPFFDVLTIAINGCGSTTPASPIVEPALTNIPVTAVPCAGSAFTGWTGGPCDGTRINPCDIPVGPQVTITANFSP